MNSSRREFLIGTAATLGALASKGALGLLADPLGKPIGAQLYVVSDLLKSDFEGTLHKVAAIGFKDVETAGFFGRKPAEFKKALDDAGLSCKSVHFFPDVSPEQTLEFANVLGAKYVVSSFTPEFLKKKLQTDKFEPAKFLAMLSGLKLDDFKELAEGCNRLGERAKAAGRKYAYHNHNVEFKPFGNKKGFDILLKETSSDLVRLELDCAWAAAAGESVPKLLQENPTRFRLLHIKNFKKIDKPIYSLAEPPVFTTLGEGVIDYKSVFAAAKRTAVEHYFVEHEPPYDVVTPMEVLKQGFAYLHKLN